MQRILCSVKDMCCQHTCTIYSDYSLLGIFLEQILSGETTKTVVGLIHKYLTTIGENVHEDKIKLDESIVFKVNLYLLVVKLLLIWVFPKWLGENPEDYPDTRS